MRWICILESGVNLDSREFVNTSLHTYHSTMQTTSSKQGEIERNLFEGLITALANKQSQVDLTFNRTSVRFPGTSVGMEINGSLSLVVHMRELSDEEKQLLASKNVSNLSSNSSEKEKFSPLK